MAEEENKPSPKVVVSTPVAVIIAGVIIALSIVATNSGLLGFLESAPKTAESTGYKFQAHLNLAKELGIKDKDFKSCMETFDKSEIEKDTQDGQAAGVGGTPSFFIGKSTSDGNLKAVSLVGAQPLEQFQAVIDGLLEGDDQKVLSTQVDPTTGTVPEKLEDVLVDVSIDDDPVMGDSNAPITVIEFSDFECPFCKRAFVQTYPTIKSSYVDGGKVKMVFRDFPLPFHDPAATEEAIAANCVKQIAGDSKYFEYHDKLFNTTKGDGKGI
ncbi:hypothetical protein CO058_00865 [candidate division WWE3 bacterium CG_4_9_14_0_2_um_filter_35_11]|uniref:Thioredoxin domain-containing protein n=1 Tax=candidate division WWE3 bacterium CG_4_9_14_0_2_um_filter_35_11 TaxID=1975077 RepID=A0A2M8EMH3_UNCKA|nr:MAG: hypothetical protein COV25_00655 [candidate division WWE3 bacterium CG10_big_fil_rev_8_21_14_0_10_35_32]PJC23946.1 MAG: hypothetical protein CO058_00865 [candidate division WWE3 bacterium CG_4_9_14_0_2_um_filter_35_11]